MMMMMMMMMMRIVINALHIGGTPCSPARCGQSLRAWGGQVRSLAERVGEQVRGAISKQTTGGGAAEGSVSEHGSAANHRVETSKAQAASATTPKDLLGNRLLALSLNEEVSPLPEDFDNLDYLLLYFGGRQAGVLAGRAAPPKAPPQRDAHPTPLMCLLNPHLLAPHQVNGARTASRSYLR